MLYYRKAWKEIPVFEITENANQNFPVISIIIAARNEEKNIGKCIQSIIDQTYPSDKFEILVTDDHSADQTVPVIESFQKENIKILHLADFVSDQNINSYKKNQ
jgi:glycosyltransferase involved in cell wall biosynthesis